MSRHFSVSKAKEKWVTDVTEFSLQGKKLYLSPVFDLFNREIISCTLSEKLVMEMINTMLRDVFSKPGPEDTPQLHSDQDRQYRMAGCQEKLKAWVIEQSISRKGKCLDNAIVETFFWQTEIGIFSPQPVQQPCRIEESDKEIHQLLQQRTDKPETKMPGSGRITDSGSDSRLISPIHLYGIRPLRSGI